MLKPPAAVAWAAYATTMLLNPNNHALDGGPATAAMEKRGRRAARRRCSASTRHLGPPDRLGDDRQPRGALGRARAAPRRARSSRARTPTTPTRACAAVLGARARDGPAGRPRAASTSTRSRRGCARAASARSSPRRARPRSARVDDVAAIADLCAEHGARLHVDAAYGGFFAPAGRRRRARRRAPSRSPRSRGADSIVVDPHKHGLQPYGCGCVLFADPGVGRLYAHDSPYTYFTSGELHLGEISLECSRAGAARRRAVDDAARAAADARGARPAPRRRAPRRRARAWPPARRRRADDARGRAGARHRLRRARRRLGRERPRRRRARLRHARARTAGTSRSCASTPAGCAAATREVEADAPATTVLRCCLHEAGARGASRPSWPPRSPLTSPTPPPDAARFSSRGGVPMLPRCRAIVPTRPGAEAVAGRARTPGGCCGARASARRRPSSTTSPAAGGRRPSTGSCGAGAAPTATGRWWARRRGWTAARSTPSTSGVTTCSGGWTGWSARSARSSRS